MTILPCLFGLGLFELGLFEPGLPGPGLLPLRGLRLPRRRRLLWLLPSGASFFVCLFCCSLFCRSLGFLLPQLFSLPVFGFWQYVACVVSALAVGPVLVVGPCSDGWQESLLKVLSCCGRLAGLTCPESLPWIRSSSYLGRRAKSPVDAGCLSM